jgi:type IV secretory pathway VirB10-like protein
MPETTRLGLLTTLKAFGTACAALAWVHFTWTTATIRSKQIVQEAKKNPDEPDEFKPVVPPSDPPKPVEEARPSIQPASPAGTSAPAASQPAGWNRASRPESFSTAQQV